MTSQTYKILSNTCRIIVFYIKVCSYIKNFKYKINVEVWIITVYKAIYVAPHPLWFLMCCHLCKLIKAFIQNKYIKVKIYLKKSLIELICLILIKFLTIQKSFAKFVCFVSSKFYLILGFITKQKGYTK